MGRWPALLALLAAGALAVVAATVVYEPPTVVPCELVENPPRGDLPPGVEPATLSLQSGERAQLGFGRRRGAKSLTVHLLAGEATPGMGRSPRTPPTPLHVDIGEFRRDDDGRIPARAIQADAIAEGSTVRVRLCIDRKATSVEPGTYAGGVKILDPRVAETTVPFTVTVAWPEPWLVAGLLLVVLPLASWYVWTLKEQVEADRRVWGRRGTSGFLRWAFSVGGLLSLSTGLVAALATFNGVYLRNATWGATSWDPFALFGAMFTAFVTAATLQRAGAGRPPASRG